MENRAQPSMEYLLREASNPTVDSSLTTKVSRIGSKFRILVVLFTIMVFLELKIFLRIESRSFQVFC